MITNSRQYKIALAKADEFRNVLENYDPSGAVVSGLDPVFAKAHENALASQLAEIEEEVSKYETLLDSDPAAIKPAVLADLPLALIQARIASGLTQKELAEKMGLKEQQVQRYEAERYRSAKFERLLAFADALKIQFGGDVTEEDTIFERDNYPFNEMYNRGWFEDFAGTLNEAKECAAELLESFFVSSGQLDTAPALHRKSNAISYIDDFALAAWQAKVMTVAQFQNLETNFDLNTLNDEWVSALVHLSAERDGPIQAVEYLLSSGIHFVYEPHLPRTRLDGAAMAGLDGNPIIGLTLRYDRLDNFWFSLLHEVGHVILHIATGKIALVFDDNDEVSDTDIEVEADQFASNALLSDEAWSRCISRFSQTERSIQIDTEKLGINAAIIAGKIRKETENYTILGGLVGEGEVRRHFQNVERITQNV